MKDIKSYAKVNIFLKIVGKRGDYHLLSSRFMRVKNLFDTISFENGSYDQFTLEGDFGCSVEQNSIYKAYLKLVEYDQKVKTFFQTHKVVVDKKIPEFAGLGGGSSNCATFLNMVNKVCDLNISKDELAKIGSTIGADVPFFVYEYDSANVTGVGEIVEKFDENCLDIKTFTPNIKCDTGEIFRSFREKFYKNISQDEVTNLLNSKSENILKNYQIDEVNDLYQAAVDIYPTLTPQNYNLAKNSFFSGSGSSFFYINQGDNSGKI